MFIHGTGPLTYNSIWIDLNFLYALHLNQMVNDNISLSYNTLLILISSPLTPSTNNLWSWSILTEKSITQALITRRGQW